jgi:quercetin dioxygenase-like cupin family protein
MHVVGKLAETAADAGPFAGRAEGLTRRPLFDRDRGTVHHSLVHFELTSDGRIERHMHAFEQALYVLAGSVVVDVTGTPEELAADDYLCIEVGVPHTVASASSEPAAWLEVSAPNPGARFEDTVFTEGPGAAPDLPYRRGTSTSATCPSRAETSSPAPARTSAAPPSACSSTPTSARASSS